MNRITAETGPTGITVITVPANMPFVTVEFDGLHEPAGPGETAPDGPRIMRALAQSGMVAAVFGCPHGAVAIVPVEPAPQDSDEEECARVSAQHALARVFQQGEHEGMASPARETRSCTSRRYPEELQERL